MTAKRLVFDVETDGLLHELTRIHCLCIEDVDSGETYRYRNNITEDNIEEGIDQLVNADLIIGHNIINFDLPALDTVYPGTASRLSSVGIYDTQVSAAVVYAHRKELDYKLRPKPLPQNLYGSQALEAWGYRLGCEKGTFGKSTDWQEWSDAMEEYCAQDVTVNVKLFVHLIQRKYSQQCIDLEHAFAVIMQRQMANGVGFNSTGGETLYVEVESQRLSLEAELQKTIPGKVITGKTPQYWSTHWPSAPGNTYQAVTKKQTLDLARPHRPKTDRVGDIVFTAGPPKEKHIPFNPSSTKQIGEYLIRQHSWEPTEFTDGGEPKVTEAVLSCLDYPEVPKLRKYLMLKKRISQISSGQEGWLKHDKDGIIYGRIKTNATITGRCSHASPNLAQVPAVKHNKIGDVLKGIEGGYGYECRALFRPTRKGWVMVGADASGLELRCLAHYLSKWDGGEYADQILNGDIHTYNQKAAGLPTRDNAWVGILMILVIHTFGEYLGWHPHLHILCADGLFRQSGLFYCMRPVDLQELELLFRDRVLKFMVQAGKIAQATADQISAWPHSGFGVDNGSVIAKNDTAAIERVAQYMLRNPFALSKMTYNEHSATVIYRSKPDYHSKCNFKVFSAEAFIAAITQHIPAHGFQNVRYYGWYSNKSRGQRRKQRLAAATEDPPNGGADVIDVSDYPPKKHASKKWRELIKKVWEVEPLICPKCGKPMRVIALIDDPGVVFEILSHLGLWDSVNAQPRSRAPPGPADGAYPTPSEGEPYVIVHEAYASFDGVDELPQDELPTILYD